MVSFPGCASGCPYVERLLNDNVSQTRRPEPLVLLSIFGERTLPDGSEPVSEES